MYTYTPLTPLFPVSWELGRPCFRLFYVPTRDLVYFSQRGTRKRVNFPLYTILFCREETPAHLEAHANLCVVVTRQNVPTATTTPDALSQRLMSDRRTTHGYFFARRKGRPPFPSL